jgi:peroxiredoxin
MRKKLLLFMLAISMLASGEQARAADKSEAKADLEKLVDTIQGKLKGGKNTEKDLSEELKQFDTLLARYKEEKTDDVAQIVLMKAMLYVQVLDNPEKGLESLKQLKSDFHETEPGKKADDLIAKVQQQQAAKKIQGNLAVGSKFPDFEEKDLAGKPISVSNYKGKVVLVDFWATWCGPCVNELPNVLKAYEKYHPQGFEIVGISLDSDQERLANFIKNRKMGWQQFFDGKGWGNKLAGKYGVNSIPATYLLDSDGKIVAKDLRGEALEAQLAKMLAKQ